MPGDMADDLAASAAGSKSIKRGFGWSLAWCHERCYKQESEGLRETIAGGVQGAGGSLVCIKKAHKFAIWLANATSPYVLLADWREVKPCMQAIARPGGHLPAMVVIMLDQPKQFQYQRVAEWVGTLAEQGFKEHMHVIVDIGELSGLIPKMLEQCRQLKQLLPRTVEFCSSSGAATLLPAKGALSLQKPAKAGAAFAPLAGFSASELLPELSSSPCALAAEAAAEALLAGARRWPHAEALHCFTAAQHALAMQHYATLGPWDSQGSTFW